MEQEKISVLVEENMKTIFALDERGVGNPPGRDRIFRRAV